MPSNYKRQSQQQSWCAVSMQNAINAVRHKNVNFSQAAKLFNIPRTTLKRRVNNINIDATGTYLL